MSLKVKYCHNGGLPSPPRPDQGRPNPANRRSRVLSGDANGATKACVGRGSGYFVAAALLASAWAYYRTRRYCARDRRSIMDANIGTAI